MGTSRSTPGDARPEWPDASWVTYATGHRVTVRLLAGGAGPSGGPAMRDVVGTLESSAADAWLVRTKAGQLTPIDPTLVVAAKVVPPIARRLRTASDIDVATLETIAAEGWQPLERELLGDWVLRASNGFTGRANSVLPIGSPGWPLDDALDAVRAWYDARALTPMFQLPLPLRDDLQVALTERGWDHHNPTHVMVCDLGQLMVLMQQAPTTAAHWDAVTSDLPDDDWLEAFRYRGQRLQPDVASILTLSERPVFVTIRDASGVTCAIGRGAVTDRWLGITAVEVIEPFRRQGLGRFVIGALAEYANQFGARHVYLQVAQGNEPAIALYRKLGFHRHHDYVYRRAVAR